MSTATHDLNNHHSPAEENLMTHTTTAAPDNVILSPANVTDHVGRLVLRRSAAQAGGDGIHQRTQQEYLVLGAGADDLHMFAVPVIHYGGYSATDPYAWNAGGSPEQVLYENGPMTMRVCRTQPSQKRVSELMAWAVARQTTDLVEARRAWQESGVEQLRDRLRVNGTDHGVSLQAVYDRLLREAERRDWCHEFEDVMEDLGLPGRKAPYTVEVRVDVPFYVILSVPAAQDSDDAELQVHADQDGTYAAAVRAAIREQVAANGDHLDVDVHWDIIETTRQD